MKIARTLLATAVIVMITAAPAAARPVNDPVDPGANSANGYVPPWHPDYYCTYQRLGSYSGIWCSYSPGSGIDRRLMR